MPSREDPYGEYDHVKPVPLEQAAHAVKCLDISVKQAKAVSIAMSRQLAAAKEKHEKLVEELKVAKFQLSLSAINSHFPTQDFVSPNV